jgi:hypothetical protein
MLLDWLLAHSTRNDGQLRGDVAWGGGERHGPDRDTASGIPLYREAYLLPQRLEKMDVVAKLPQACELDEGRKLFGNKRRLGWGDLPQKVKAASRDD